MTSSQNPTPPPYAADTLTYEFRGPEDIFEFNASLYFVRQPEVYEFDAWQGDVSVQEHDVFRLENETEGNVCQISSADTNGRDEREQVTCPGR